MNNNEFFNKLENVANAYHWNVDGNRIVAEIQRGWNRGCTLNPITALAHKAHLGFFNNTRDETEAAASLLGIPRSFARHVHSATLASCNRGHIQVVRGRIRSALEV